VVDGNCLTFDIRGLRYQVPLDRWVREYIFNNVHRINITNGGNIYHLFFYDFDVNVEKQCYNNSGMSQL